MREEIHRHEEDLFMLILEKFEEMHEEYNFRDNDYKVFLEMLSKLRRKCEEREREANTDSIPPLIDMRTGRYIYNEQEENDAILRYNISTRDATEEEEEEIIVNNNNNFYVNTRIRGRNQENLNQINLGELIMSQFDSFLENFMMPSTNMFMEENLHP